jgi:putative endonuclease
MDKQPTIYIMTNIHNRVLYTGVTSAPAQRFYQHKHSLIDGFTKRYNCTKLVYAESCEAMEQAIGREKQIKGWIRKKKIALIEKANPQWKDLYDEMSS